MLVLGDRSLVNRTYQLTRTLLFLTRAETVESTSSTVEYGGGERLWLGCELKYCKQHRMWELGRHDRWNYHTKPSSDGKIVSFVGVESLCDATGYPRRTPRVEDTVLDAHTREPITVIT